MKQAIPVGSARAEKALSAFLAPPISRAAKPQSPSPLESASSSHEASSAESFDRALQRRSTPDPAPRREYASEAQPPRSTKPDTAQQPRQSEQPDAAATTDADSVDPSDATAEAESDAPLAEVDADTQAQDQPGAAPAVTPSADQPKIARPAPSVAAPLTLSPGVANPELANDAEASPAPQQAAPTETSAALQDSSLQSNAGEPASTTPRTPTLKPVVAPTFAHAAQPQPTPHAAADASTPAGEPANQAVTSAALDSASSPDQHPQRDHDGAQPGESRASAAAAEAEQAKPAPAGAAAPRSPDSIFQLHTTSLTPKQTPTLAAHSPNGPAGSTAQSPSAQADSPTAQAVARGLAAAVAQRGGSVSMRLVPESLGQVRIEMQLERGAVAVRIEASTPAAQGLLEGSLAALRGSLEAKGLTVDRLFVQLAPAPHGAPAAPSAQNQPHNSGDSSTWNNAGSQQHNAAGQESRGGGERTPGRSPASDEPAFDIDEIAQRPGGFGARLALHTVA